MKKVAFLAIISFITMTSCISVQFANIDVQNPAKVTFPREVVNLAIVNNVPPIPKDKDAPASEEILSMDSLSSVFVDSLAYYLDKQEFYGQILSYPKVIRTDYNSRTIKPLSKEQVQSITDEMKVDGLISIDLYQIQGSLDTQSAGYLSSIQELAIEIYVLIRAYTADGEEIQEPILFSDTLYWQGIPNIQFKEYALPTLSEICTYVNGYAVEKALNAFVPFWSTEERAYFANGSPLMNQATKFVKENKWNDAISIWEEAYKSEKNQAKKVRIAYNLALGYETIDNISKAVTWIRAAKNSEGYLQHSDIREQIDWYYKELLKREMQTKKLKEQIGITETNTTD